MSDSSGMGKRPQPSLSKIAPIIGAIILILMTVLLVALFGSFPLPNRNPPDVQTDDTRYYLDVAPDRVDGGEHLQIKVSILNQKSETRHFTIIFQADFAENNTQPLVRDVTVKAGGHDDVSIRIKSERVSYRTRSLVLVRIISGSSRPVIIEESVMLEPAIPNRTSGFAILATGFVFAVLSVAGTMIKMRFGEITHVKDEFTSALTLFSTSFIIVQLLWNYFGFINDSQVTEFLVLITLLAFVAIAYIFGRES